MPFKVALSFEDGITRFIDCEPGETVADASYKSRINIPLDCRDGACGTCKSMCESGSYDGGDYIEEALTDDEAEQGYCLPCQMMPESDLVLRIPSTSAAAKTGPASHLGTLTEITRHSVTTASFTMAVDNRSALSFLPGQYVNITVPGSEETRSYSFSSGVGVDEVSFLVKLIDGGLMSGYLADRAQLGDRLEFTGPLGSFYLRELNGPALLLAGGTGLAPLLSMVERLKTSSEEQPLDHPVHLIYGVTTDADLVHLDTLAAYAETIPGFSFDYCVADANSSAPNLGFVTGLFDAGTLHDGDADVYLCGPPPMVEAVRTHISSLGVTPASFHFEKFTPGTVTAALQTSALQIGAA